MTFINLSWLAVGAGLMGLAGALYLLQRLRVRFSEVEVVTSLFWKASVAEAPARVFRQRFRHWLAYLLFFVIAALLWLALAGPQRVTAASRDNHILLLDGSAGMARTDRFASAVTRLKHDAAALPSQRRQVLWVGSQVTTLLAPDEPAALLDARLRGLMPQATPASIERALHDLAKVATSGESTRVLVYGDAPVRKEVLDLLPGWMTVRRAQATVPTGDNSGITELGVSAGISGDWTRVDVMIGIEGAQAQSIAASGLRMTLDGVAIGNIKIDALDSQSAPTGDASLQRVILRDLPASGGLLEVGIGDGDALALDDIARVRLPQRSRIRVFLSPSLPDQLAAVLANDTAVELVAQNYDIAIVRRGEPVSASSAVLEFAPRADQEAAFLLRYPDDSQAQAMLSNAMRSLGLDQIDADDLAQRAGGPIGLVVEPGAQRRFSVWAELLDESYNFTRSRAFPLFVTQSVRWLADSRAWYPSVAAGKPLPLPSEGRRPVFIAGSGALLATLGADFVPDSAGTLPTAPPDPSLAVSLLDSATTVAERSPAADALQVDSATRQLLSLLPTDAAVWLVLLAALLLIAEWYLFRTGRLP